MAMSLTAVKTLRDAIIADVVAAWSVAKVHPRGPGTEQVSLPYAWVICDSVGQDWLTARSVEQNPTFTIGGLFAMVDDPEDAKLTKADALLARLMAATGGVPAPTYAGVGMLPIVTKVEFFTAEDVLEGEYGLEVTFTVKTGSDYN